MSKKRIWFIIPACILPYLVIFALVFSFYCTRVSLFQMMMERLFRDNIWYLVASLLLFALLAVVSSVTCFVICLRRAWDPLSLAKTAMIMKLLQIPAYLVIFVLGVLLMFAIFTVPFAIALFLSDCIILFLSGLLTASSIINAARQQLIPQKDAAIFIILQFVFVADVFAAIIHYRRLFKKVKWETV